MRSLWPPWKWWKKKKGKTKPKILLKQIKFEEIDEKEEDRISALPDCLLVEILSRLSFTTEAIRTGTLSKRWKHVWTSIPTLSFGDFSKDYPLPDFYSFVDKTLTQRRPLKLNNFSVGCCYDIRFECQVNNWVRYAVNCNVEDFDLTLWSLGPLPEFELDQFFFINSHFSNLRLEGCMFNPYGAISWKNLRSLCISHSKVDENLIETILSGSPVLETLQLDYCYGFRRIDITSKSVKNLVFYGYMIPSDIYDNREDIIEINAPYILSLTILGDLLLWKLLLLNVSCLVKARLDYVKQGFCEMSHKQVQEVMFKGYLQSLHHVKELEIGNYCSKVVFRLEAKGFIFPSNVKRPAVIYNDSDSDETEDWELGQAIA